MILCINTAIAEHHVAIAACGHTARPQNFAALPLPAGRESETILSVIADLLKKAGVKPSDLTGVAAITGPGGFTSLRIGLTVANTFAHEFKIPIVGFHGDEWFAARTDETDFLYLQSMNREEIYTKGFGKSKNIAGILKFLDLPKTPTLFLGNLSALHKNRLPKNSTEIKKIKSPDGTWTALCQNFQKTNDLLLPFYGKEPTITKAKR
ncbi:tRNA (adenosine(37)-N6)-threonylcarbamoyltransferase complex dimerization subunit type 1 TsaB [Candidatus Peregrinibacteria bacterium]|nr:tRNA (adenosine(37)-N6)-threonylcarbamoyltransferase complex dimerization subunit type 1 TsaB [Candidatus Peregrinibacteria bacterium]